jgi:hypothetical protein
VPPQRRLEDRIRGLCTLALTAKGSQLDNALRDLQGALRDHVKRLRTFATAKLVTPQDKASQPPKDRRCA